MARRVNRKELCEAIRQGQARMKERMEGPGGTELKSKPEPVRFQLRQPTPRSERRPKKPLIPAKLRQFRLKVNPKYLAAAAAGLFFVILVAWLAGAISRQDSALPTAVPEGENANPVSMRPPAVEPPVRTATPSRSGSERLPARQPNPGAGSPSPTVNSKGDHVVVIATFTKREPLVPVMEHFTANGIPAEVIQRGSYYMVVTKERFEASQRTESTGKRLLQQVSEIGTRYKAPSGLPGFAKATFDSAYFRKL